MNLYVLSTIEVAQAAASQVFSLIKGKPKVALFLSGGSAINIYNPLAELLNQYSGDLVLALVDERFSSDINNKDSNFVQIAKQSHLFKTAVQNGRQVLKVLHGRNIDDEVKTYNQEVDKLFDDDHFKIAILGIGLDGHTAGILPYKNKEEINAIFDTDEKVVGYENNGPFPQRITLTPKALMSLDAAIVYAVGEEKRTVLKQLINDTSLDNLHQFPATLINQIPQVELFTDIKLG